MNSLLINLINTNNFKLANSLRNADAFVNNQSSMSSSSSSSLAAEVHCSEASKKGGCSTSIPSKCSNCGQLVCDKHKMKDDHDCHGTIPFGAPITNLDPASGAGAALSPTSPESQQAAPELNKNLGISLPNAQAVVKSPMTKILGAGAVCTYQENMEPTGTGKGADRGYFTMDPIEHGSIVMPLLYHYFAWDLWKKSKSSKKLHWARRVYKNTENGEYVFLWSILSTICFKTQHYFLYTSGKLCKTNV